MGLDGLLGWHRRNGAVLLTLVALHATLVIAASQQLSDQRSPWQALLTLMCTMPGVMLTVIAGTQIGLIGLVSLRLVRSRLPYEAWLSLPKTSSRLEILAVREIISHPARSSGSSLFRWFASHLWPSSQLSFGSSGV